jgi:hypothetical protein
MKANPGLALLAWLLLATPVAHAGTLGVLAPVLVDGEPQMRDDPEGHAVPVVTRVDTGPLYDALQVEASSGFTATMLALDEAARRTAGASAPSTTWLYLSQEEGGFARRGFWLQDASGTHYVAEPFVDLVVDADSIEDGSFEEIFAHELGHVFLHRLLPHLPPGPSRTAHASLAITDRPTAFDEGFATHFQALARRATRNPRLRDIDDGLDARPFLPYWASRLDGAWRIDGMRRNAFVQAQVPWPGEADPARALDTSALFDTGRLKSGDQMLASEGVVATLFYRWLAPGPLDTAAIVGRYEPWFEALAALDATAPTADTPFPVALLQAYAARAPDGGKAGIGTFLATTYGATLGTALPRQAEALATTGRTGDPEAFVPALKAARAALAEAAARAQADPSVLDDGIGPGVWLAVDATPSSRVLDLNTLEAEGLVALGADASLAAQVLAERRARGAFLGLDDLVARVPAARGIGPRLQAAWKRAQALGAFARR